MNKALLHAEAMSAPAQPWFEEIDLLSRHNIYFETRLANTPALAEIAYRIRYQVYCLERGFENAAEHATGLEMDAYDDRSRAGLLIYRPSGDAMGTVRVVLPDLSVDGALPVGELLHRNGLNLADYVSLKHSIEVSRFAISKDLRRRASDDSDFGGVVAGRSERIRRGNLPSLSLIQFVIRQGRERRSSHFVAAMEIKLLRMLDGMGIHFLPIGPQIMHHGIRQPCYCHVQTMLEGLRKEQPDYWQVVTDAGALMPPSA